MNKFLSFLGIVRKSGKINMGFDPCIDSIKNKKAKLLIVTYDLSEKTALKAKRFAEEANVPIITVSFSMDEMCVALGKYIGLITVTDENLASKLNELYIQLQSEQIEGGNAT